MAAHGAGLKDSGVARSSEGGMPCLGTLTMAWEMGRCGTHKCLVWTRCYNIFLLVLKFWGSRSFFEASFFQVEKRASAEEALHRIRILELISRS